MAPLSTGTMVGLLKSAKFSELCSSANQHFKNNPEDVGSAVKVVKVIGWFMHENSIGHEESRRSVVEMGIAALDIITSLEKNPAVIKDICNSLYYVTLRLGKHDKDLLLLADFVPVVFSLYEAAASNGGTSLHSAAQNLYVALWNFTISKEPSTKAEAEVVALIKVQFAALHFQLLNPNSETFSHAKLVAKVTNVSTIMADKQSVTAKRMLASNLLRLLRHPALLAAEHAHYWSLWSFAVGFNLKHGLTESLAETLDIKLASGNVLGDRKVMEFLVQLKAIGKDRTTTTVAEASNVDFVNVKDVDISDEFACFVCGLLISVISEIGETLVKLRSKNSSTFDTIVRNCISVCKACQTQASVLQGLKVLTSLEAIEIKEDNHLVMARIDLVRELLNCHKKLVCLLDKADAGDSVKKSAIYKLFYSLYSIGCCLNKESSEAEEFMDRCCRWTPRILELDPTHPSETFYPRWKNLFDIQYKRLKFKEALVSLSLGLVCLVTSDLKKQAIQDKLEDVARSVWVKVRIQWINQEKQARKDNEKENTETGEADGDEDPLEEMLSSTNIVTLLRSSNVGLEISEAVLKRLLVWEIYAYRQAYPEGVDLRQTTTSCLCLVMEMSRDCRLTIALSLLEQTNIYWFGDNIEDLEMGAKCCEKAYKWLTDMEDDLACKATYLGLALFLRFLCEHRLLQIQISNEVLEEQERKALEGRKELQGVGEGQQEQADVFRPNFPGLELAIQYKLVEYLEGSKQHFLETNFQDVCEWFSQKNILDIQLALAYQLELFNRQSMDLLTQISRLAEEADKAEHLVLSSIRIIKQNPTVHLDRVEKLSDLGSRTDDLSKLSPLLTFEISLCLAHIYLQIGELEACEEILNAVLRKLVTQNSFRANLLNAEARLIGSQLCFLRRIGKFGDKKTKEAEEEEEDFVGVCGQGPVELASDAFKLVRLCAKYLEDDLRLPSTQQSGLMMFEPRLSLLHYNSVNQIIKLTKHIASPRMLRAFVKEGLLYAQSHCLPHHATEFLIEMARTNLLYDDDDSAWVQLNGILGVLGDLIKPEEARQKVIVEDTGEEEMVVLPGDDQARAASPALKRAPLLPPTFLDDDVGCDCENCTNPSLHLVILHFFNVKACTLMMAGEHRAGKLLFKTSHAYTPKLRSKYNSAMTWLGRDSDFGREMFSENLLGCLLAEIESLAYSGDFESAGHVAQAVTTRNTKPSLEIQPHLERLSISQALETKAPAAVCKFIEMKEAVKKIAKAGSPGDRNRETELLSAFQRLSCKVSEPVTPDPRRKASAAKAPSKRVVPALGPGDAAGVIKDLEKLSLYTANNDASDSPVIKIKQAPRSKHRLFRLEDLAECESVSKTKTGKPKIIVTADTPRKFFKSKNQVASSIATAASVSTQSLATSAAAATPAKSTGKSSAKSDGSLAKKPLTPTKLSDNKSTTGKKAPVKSAKSSVSIYEDFNGVEPAAPFKTPARAAPTSTATGPTSRRPTRSTRKAAAAEEPAAAEAEPAAPATKRSSRKPIKRL